MVMKFGPNGSQTIISRVMGKTKLILEISKNDHEIQSKRLSDAYFSSYRQKK